MNQWFVWLYLYMIIFYLCHFIDYYKIYRRTAPGPPPCHGVIPVQHTNVYSLFFSILHRNWKIIEQTCIKFLINFRVIWVTLGHNWPLGGTPWHPWDCQGVPGWNLDQFFVILGSPFGALGDPLVVTFGPLAHQVRQIEAKNGVKWPPMQRIWQKLAFRMGSCCPRAGF